MTSPTPQVQTPGATANGGLLTNQKPWRRTLDRIRSEYGYLLFAALIPAVIVYLLYLVRGIYPFGESSVLVLDLNGQYISFYEALHKILHGDADLFYSFSRNLGGEFLGIYDYYVASPFALILGLFPESWMLEGLLLVFILKAAFCGLNMGIYLHKHAAGEPNRLAVLAFSIMYALCSYCIIHQHNSMWIDTVLWLPLLTLGIEEMIKRGRFRLYVFSLAVILWSNFYMGYMVVIFTVAYCFYYYFAHNRNNENNPLGEKNHFVKSVIRMLGWSLFAVGIAAFIIFSARYSLSLGKDDFRSPSWEITQKFDLFQFFHKFLPGSYDTLRPMALPIVYCGVLTVMLVPAFFMSKKFSMREKVAAAIFILFFIASFATSSLDLIWHGFQKPNWLNYRYSFMLSFFLVVLAYRAFDRIAFTSRKSLLGAVAFIAMYVMLLPLLADHFILMNGSEEVTTSYIRPFATVWLSLGCLFVYFILISLYGKVKERQKETVSIILVFVVCVELFLSGMADMEELNIDVSYTKYTKYNGIIDVLRPIADTIQEHDKGFYRTEKTVERKSNDGMAVGMYGLTNSSSTFNKETIDFLDDMGYDSKDHNSHYKDGRNAVSDMLLGVKYIITDQDMSAYYGDPLYTKEDFGYDEDFVPYGEYNKNYVVYQNRYALPLSFGVAEDYMTFKPDDYTSPITRMNAMITAMLGEDKLVEVFKPAIQNGDPVLKNIEISDTRDNHLHYEVKDKNSTTATLTYSYTVPANTELFFYYPTRYARNMDLKVNGGNKIDYNGNITPLGKFNTETISLEAQIDNTSKNLWIEEMSVPCYVYSIDMELLAEVSERLAAFGLTIDEGFTDSHLFGSVTTTSEKQLMFTSIAYDDGWNVYVDGERVDIHKTSDALLSFYVEGAGEHRVELRYMPGVVALGLSVTIICAIVFVLLLLLYPYLKRVRILRRLIMIEGDELPEIMSPEMMAGIESGDIGADEELSLGDRKPAAKIAPAKGDKTSAPGTKKNKK